MIDENQEVEIKSTKSEIEEFKKSFLWMDIKDELDKLAERAQLEYDLVGESVVNDEGVRVTPTTAEVLIHLGDIKGRKKSVNYFLNILDIFLQLLEDQTEDQEDDTEHK